MPQRRGASIGSSRPVANAVLLDEIRSLHTRMETIETSQRRATDEGDARVIEESSEEEEEIESEAAKVLKVLAKECGRPKMEIPLYDGNLNVEELMDWINSLNKYFEYEEEVDGKNKVKFVATRLKGHTAI